MKKHLNKMMIMAILVVAAALSSTSASAQVYVNVRPVFARPHSKPPAPSRGAVWIDEDWANRGGRYVSVGGHWASPPHPGYIYVPGRWAHEKRGDYWVAGRWKRR